MKKIIGASIVAISLALLCGCSQQSNMLTQESHLKALKMVITSAPMLKSVVLGRKFQDVDTALNEEYQVSSLPKVGGGVIYQWSYKEAPNNTWIQVEHQEKSIFVVSMQIGMRSQQAQYVADISNGAVQRRFDSFSSQLGY